MNAKHPTLPTLEGPARKLRQQLLKHGAALELDPTLDHAIIDVACQAYAELVTACQEMINNPPLFEAENGKVYLSPCVRAVMDQARAVLTKSRDLNVREHRPPKPRWSKAEILFRAHLSPKSKAR